MLLKRSKQIRNSLHILTIVLLQVNTNLLAQPTKDSIAKNTNQQIKKHHEFFDLLHMLYLRKGKLFNNVSVTKSLKGDLKPLDILAEKAPFQLTDKLIPGHFGHVAMWIGTKEDLIEKGLWNSEIIKPFQSEIEANVSRQGKNIIEAVPSGVRLISLEDFLNADDLVVIRPKFLTSSDLKEKLLFTFKQLGKEYDFGFDISTPNKIVCSELAYLCFPTISWQTKKILGRFTISPDNIVNTCVNEQNFELIKFFHRGKENKEKDRIKLLKILTKHS